MSSSVSKSQRSRNRRRLLALLAAAVVVAAALGAAGYYVFTGWRARDLASKAQTNLGEGNYRLAWLQLNSAKSLRPNDPQVLRASGMIEGSMGQSSALEAFEKLAQKTDLTPEDLKSRAEIAVRFGTDAQSAGAVDSLEAAGQEAEAGRLRAVRELRQGDIDRAIVEARKAAAASDDPAAKFSLARLLVQRYRPEFGPDRNPSGAALAGSAEAVQIIDGLLATPQRDIALAFALNEVETTAENLRRWAASAMKNVATENPSLLPAASVLLRGRQKTAQQIHDQLRPIFDAAPLERRAAYALWLTGAGLPKEALTLITAQEAGESTAAFGARTEALFAMANLDGVLVAVEAGGNVDPDILLAAKARAEYARGRGAQGGAAALREAISAAARARRLEFITPTGDALGARTVVDEKIAELCSDPAVSDYAFRVARDRFSRNGRVALLSSAFERAQTASPQSPAVEDYRRYLALIGGGKVGIEETAAACEAEPANTIFRITHALNLLENNRPAEALAAFNDITVFADRLAPAQLAVIAAVLAANGDVARARAAAGSIDLQLLSPGEYALVVPLRTGAD